MSDEQRHDDSDPVAGGAAPGRPHPDETAPMPAHRRDEQPAPGDEPTTVLPAGGQGGDEPPARGAGGDEPTTALPAGGGRGDDATTVLPAGGPAATPAGNEPTSVIPPVGGRPVPQNERTSVMPAQDVWTGRAGVPDPEPRPMRDATPPPGIEYAEGERTWRAPLIIIGIALLLLALFAVGAWFALRGSGPAPEPSTSPTPAATSAAPSSAAPSPSASPSPQVAAVPVPADLVGLSQQEAIDALNAVGLNPRISLQVTDEADPGTVVDVDPEAGTLLEPGSTVTIFVASAPPSPSPEPSPSPSAETSPSPEGGGD